MPWKVVERRIGRAGGTKQRTGRQREWDKKYGQDNWMVGYVIQGEFVSQEVAIETIYYKSYEAYFGQHPEDLAELVKTAKSLRNPHAEATNGVDLQIPAIMSYLERHGISLQGHDVVDIGSYGERSHALSVRLSPLHIQAYGYPDITLEAFWQEKKCLAIWEED